MNRRELCSLLPFLALAGYGSAADQTLSSAEFPFADLPVKSNGGTITRKIVDGKIPTGEHVEIHETTLAPGAAPHAPHKHAHSEFWLIREGTVELNINGQIHQLTAGSAGLAASNDLHGIKNVGATPATYFVVAIGVMNA